MSCSATLLNVSNGKQTSHSLVLGTVGYGNAFTLLVLPVPWFDVVYANMNGFANETFSQKSRTISAGKTFGCSLFCFVGPVSLLGFGSPERLARPHRLTNRPTLVRAQKQIATFALSH